MQKLLSTASVNGLKVTVVTRPDTDYKEKDRLSVQKKAQPLKDSGIDVAFKSKIHQKFAIIDQKIVWVWKY